jgi:hypothetical protein
MAHHFHYIRTDSAPVKDIARVVDSLWADELLDYATSPTPEHLFRHLVAVANWLNAGADWTPERYVAAAEETPGSDWTVARTYMSEEPPPAPSDREPADPDEEPEWKYLGVGSRYRVTRRGDSLVTIVGWDRPLSTFFAQVWDVPPGVKNHEAGQLLLWAGCTPNELGSVDELEEIVANYTTLPRALQLRLEKDRLGFNPALLP